MRHALGLGGLLLVATVAGGCDPAEPLDGGLLLGTIDTHHFCDVDTVEVRLRAHWLACAEQDPDCEPPEATVVDGDRFTCPATEATRDLGVELSHAGRYRIEAVRILTSGPSVLECFTDPATGDTGVELPPERLFGASVVRLDQHGPCPE